MLNIAEINLTTLKNNALAVKKKLNRNTKFCAVVKADAYGHGGVDVANCLHDIVDCFAVALPEEGIALRQGGITKDVLVLIPVFEVDLERAIYYRLTLTVTSALQLKAIEELAKRLNLIAKVHVKYNTGMNRQGVDDLLKLKDIFDYSLCCSHVKVEGLYSHFAKPESKKSVNRALDKFLLAIRLGVGYNDKLIVHVSASGGFLQGIEFGMVRIGLLLYGYKPFKTDQISVRPVMKIYAPIVQKRKLKRGDRVLYGEKLMQKNSDGFLVRFGYADGLPRKEGYGLLNNRCMDLSMLSNPRIKGNFAVILDDADLLAKEYGTISYEILTQASKRAERIYVF